MSFKKVSYYFVRWDESAVPSILFAKFSWINLSQRQTSGGGRSFILLLDKSRNVILSSSHSSTGNSSNSFLLIFTFCSELFQYLLKPLGRDFSLFSDNSSSDWKYVYHHPIFRWNVVGLVRTTREISRTHLNSFVRFANKMLSILLICLLLYRYWSSTTNRIPTFVNRGLQSALGFLCKAYWRNNKLFSYKWTRPRRRKIVQSISFADEQFAQIPSLGDVRR